MGEQSQPSQHRQVQSGNKGPVMHMNLKVKREYAVGGIMNSSAQTIGRLPTAHYQPTLGASTCLRNFTLDSH